MAARRPADSGGSQAEVDRLAERREKLFADLVALERNRREAVAAGKANGVLDERSQELVSKLPYLPVLQKSIENAEPRPVTPFYPAVTKAVQDNAYAALQGQKSVDQALKDMQAAIKSATGG